MHKRLFTILILLLSHGVSSYGQATFQDCFGAIPVCSDFYNQPNGFFGVGGFDEIAQSTTCLLNGENNSVWYIFTVSGAGNLQFDLTPLANDDYDFALYNITNGGCSSIFDGTNPPVRCNFAPTVGTPTGLRAGFVDTSAGVNGDPFLAPLPVMVNETYVLLVDNFTDGGQGYELDFTNGTANIVDNIPPSIDTIQALSCDTTSSLVIFFTEPIECGSVLADGSQFTLSGTPTLLLVGAEPLDCDTGNFTTSARIYLDKPILAKVPYTISILNGTGNQAIEDVCGNSATGATFVFTPPAIILPGFRVNFRASCIADTAIFANISSPDTSNGNPVWSWDFGDGSPTVSGTRATHIYPGYQAYTVTLTATTDDGCSFSFDSVINVTRSYLADFEWSPMPACPEIPIQFTDISPGAANSWVWDFGDQSLSADQNPTHIFLEPGTYPVKLVIADNTSLPPCTDSVTINVVVNDNAQAAFEIDQNQICAGEPVQFMDLTSGNPTDWSWDFGNGQVSTEQSPLFTYDSTGAFEVKLLVDNGCGNDSTFETYSVNEVPAFNLGNDTTLCFDAKLTLVAFPGADRTEWSTGETGDSIAFENIPGEVRVTVTNDGCAFEDAILVDEQLDDCAVVPLPGGFTPNGDGINDGFRLVNPQRITDVEIHIFNRWGEEVFSDNRINFNWDGTYKGEPQPMGVYTYYMSYSVFTSAGKQSGYYVRSSVTLVR